MQKIIEDKLQLPSMNLERAHHVGPGDPSRPRIIVARFDKFADRETVLRNARKLKGSRLSINEDLCAASQALRTSQLPQLKQARKDGKIAFFKYTRLVIKDRLMRQPNNKASMSHPTTTTASMSHLTTTTASTSPPTTTTASLSLPTITTASMSLSISTTASASPVCTAPA